WSRFLPLVDLPNQLAQVAAWHRYGDASWGYQKFYQLERGPWPPFGYVFPVHWLAYLMPIEFANRVYLSAYAIALPLGVARLGQRMGRSPWLSVFAFPLVFNFDLSMGFVAFCGALAILFHALYALDVLVEEPSRRRALIVSVFAIAL